MEYDLEKISNNIQNKKKIIKIFQILFLIVLIIFFLICSFLINYNQDTDEPRNFLGIYVFDIVSKSMTPSLNEDDIVIVKKIKLTELKQNDIISFRNGNNIISHRILKIEKNNNEYTFITKGDNNDSEDDFEVKFEQIYGKVILRIPNIGSKIRYLHKKNGLLSIIILTLLLYFVYNLTQVRKFTRKKKRWKYETKKKREKYKLEDEVNENKPQI